MTKRTLLLLLLGVILGASPASAADVRIAGMWDFNLEWNRLSFSKETQDDVFHARQRLRTQVDIVASESLKGVVFFEIGDQNWGMTSEGASLGTDGAVIEVRYSYVDWRAAEAGLHFRLGLQPYALPGFVAGSPVLAEVDGAGITLNHQFVENAGVTAFWLRAEHGNLFEESSRTRQGTGDALDFWGVSFPLAGKDWKLTPWGVYATVGRNSLRGTEGGVVAYVRDGMRPFGIGGDCEADLKKASCPAWWLGVGGELTRFTPFRAAFDVMGGSVNRGSVHMSPHNSKLDLARRGWMIDALVEYALSGMHPGLLVWYSSGDDGNPYNGSERMPTVRPSWLGSSLGFDDGSPIAGGDAIGLSPVGTWGVIGRVSGISFLENLGHTLRIGWYTGTNDEEAVKRGGTFFFGHAFDNGVSTWLTRKDHALEVNFDSRYTPAPNLALTLELGYIRLNLDKAVWKNAVDPETPRKNAWKAGMNLRYAF